MNSSRKKQLATLFISILIPVLGGSLSALLSGNNRQLYETIQQPSFAPPAIVFPIVWTILYVLMGISSYLIYTSGDERTKDALRIYEIQLLLNFTWSIIFFGYGAYWLAALWILLLWMSIAAMIVAFKQIRPLAAYLQIPYLLWVTFAFVLNVAFARLNG